MNRERFEQAAKWPVFDIGVGHKVGLPRYQGELIASSSMSAVFKDRDSAFKVVPLGIVSSIPPFQSRLLTPSTIESYGKIPQTDHCYLQGSEGVFTFGKQGTKRRVQSFLKEIEVYQRMRDDSNTLTLVGTGIDFVNHLAYGWMQMPLIEYATLKEKLKAVEQTTLGGVAATVHYQKSASLAYDLATTLERFHAKGIVHRDVKPGNIFVDPQGKPFLFDFGISQFMHGAPYDLDNARREFLHEKFFAPGTVFGTASYIHPKAASGTDVGPEADLYGFAGTFYEMMMLERAFRSSIVTQTLADVVIDYKDHPVKKQKISDLEKRLAHTLGQEIGKSAALVLQEAWINEELDAVLAACKNFKELMDGYAAENPAMQFTRVPTQRIPLGGSLPAPPRPRNGSPTPPRVMKVDLGIHYGRSIKNGEFSQTFQKETSCVKATPLIPSVPYRLEGLLHDRQITQVTSSDNQYLLTFSDGIQISFGEHDASQVQFFINTIQAHVRLEGNPNVLELERYGVDLTTQGAIGWIKMPWQNHRTMGQVLQDRRKNDEVPDPFYYTLQAGVAATLANTINTAHKAGVIHNDIKPDNIFCKPDHGSKPYRIQPMLFDFELAQLVEDHGGMGDLDPALQGFLATNFNQNIVLGTPGYTHPKRIQSEDVGAKNDLFGFATTFFEMMTLQRGFQGASRAHTAFNTVHANLQQKASDAQDIVDQYIGRDVAIAVGDVLRAAWCDEDMQATIQACQELEQRLAA